MGWLPDTTEHTFKDSGRTAVIVASPNVYALFSNEELAPHLEAFQKGELNEPAVALRIVEEIVRMMMVRPRIARQDEPLPEGQDHDDPEVVPYEALQMAEVDELAELWMEEHAKAERFRGESDGDDAGGDGEGVGNDPKPARRSGSRKPAGSGGRPRSRKKAA